MSEQSAVYLVEGKRTPIGAFQGCLSGVAAPALGGTAIQGVLKATGIEGGALDEVIMGCVLPAALGQAPARQAMIAAGVPHHVGALTLNKVCGSGLKAMMVARSEILAGEAQLIMAGGMESMSRAPYYLTTARNGFRMGHQDVIDGMIHDGLWDPYENIHMGNAGDICAKKYNFSREEQDAFALASYQRSRQAVESGAFKGEITPVEVPQRKGDPVVVDTDEQPFKDDPAKLAGLRAAFQKDGTVTAGNASTINDGAAAFLVASQAAVQANGLKPKARIVSVATHSQEPTWFTTAPVGAIEKALKKAKLTAQDIDLFEINEAFAVVTMVAMKDLNLPHEKVNVRGGAVSLGHPIGASGARIMVTLVHALHDMDKQFGVASLCIGGGEAVAVAVERL